MTYTFGEVLSGARPCSCDRADCLEWLAALPDGCVDLAFGSPPYEEARLYLEAGANLGISRKTAAWVEWMVEVYRACLRVCKGMVAFVVGHGQTRGFRWSGAPALLMAELLRAGLCLRDPKVYRRIGIPGSGGPDDFRRDFEWVICATRGGKLPWSNNVACGHVPKWGPGGEMSHRLTDGTRRNQWGGNEKSGTSRRKDGSIQPAGRPSHKLVKTGATRGYKDGDTLNEGVYVPPALANPGNVVVQTYTAEEVAALLAEAGNVVDCKAGGNQMGNELCHANEAPFPESLAERFVLSFCPPGGIVCDPFSGSGTTAAVSVRHGRRFIGCDLRQSQVELTLRRVSTETPLGLFNAPEESP